LGSDPLGERQGRLAGHAFLVERSLGKRVAEALANHGFEVVRFAEHFAPDAPDEQWIERAAASHWVVLTKDSGLSRHPNERLAIRISGLRVFTLARAMWKSEDMAKAFIAAERRIARTLASHTGPFIARINKTGRILRVEDL
jgi:hypothetical protein